MQKTIGWKDKFQTNKRNQISVLKVWVRLLSDSYRFVQDRLLQHLLICATFTVNREFWRCGTICQVYLFCLVKDLNENILNCSLSACLFIFLFGYLLKIFQCFVKIRIQGIRSLNPEVEISKCFVFSDILFIMKLFHKQSKYHPMNGKSEST